MKVNAGQTAGMHGAMMPPQAGSMGGMQLAYMQAAQQMGQPGMMLPAMPAGGALPQMVMAPQQQAGLPVAAAGALPMGMLGGGGGLPDPYAPVPPATSPTPFGAPGGGPMMGLDLQLNGGGYGGGGGAPPAAQLSGDDSQGGGSQGGDSKHRKTAKQQEANKIAQQRYRERKKQKFVEMEAQISVLSKQLAALQALQSRNQILEGLNGELQTQLMSKEKEVERLKLALDVSAERSLSGHSHPSSPSADGDHGTTTALREHGDEASHPTTNACDLLPQDMAGIDFKKGFADQVVRLREFVELHGVTQGAVADHGLTPQQMQELGMIVARSCQLCQAALRAEGVRVIELISKDPSSFSTVDSATEAARWAQCLHVMHLAPEQQEAMSLMLPHSSKNPSEDNTVEGRMQNMSQAGYLHVAKSSAELGDVLDKIKDNLRREQRAVMDLNCQLISKILTPLQGAHYMLKAYPQHCDALALSNTLAKHLGREEFSEGGAAAAAGAANPGIACQADGGCC
ncbi:expressed protein [Chlorella variabilis]|uniref:Expressed protein n=1 Tax=Chlorella variabilis TaxID=554065 RepID=E1Z8R2_CHLVA|nr:expressed protein [Chlorella variabilis]EFN57652.1 expressed protein [Chlorella variabilis]|eukprot:XP_005849754.1 expressed protein [Chlorella variabilis]